MKYYFLATMMLVCAYCFAQEPVLTDDLNTGMDAIVKNHNISFKLNPVQFNETINRARKDAYRQIKSGSAKETKLKRLDVDYYLRNLLSNYSTFHPFKGKGVMEQMTVAQQKYVDSLIYSKTDLNNETLYKRSAAYREWLDAYLDKTYQTKYKSDTTFKNVTEYIKGALPVSVVAGEVRNPFIRDYECYQHSSQSLKQIKKDSVLAKKLYQDFNATVTNTYYREQIRQVYDNYEHLLHIVGTAAPDFTYAAVDGKPVTLSNLRGKYVYIDVWATWCGPCKMEIPYLKKVEEKYKDKNIQFVSLSVDYQAQAGAWRAYVTDNKLPGYQVMADKAFKSDFIQKFNIAAIPRFLLIDAAGNVVDADAKRPSDPALKKQLDKLLGLQAGPFALSPYARQNDFSGHWQLNKSKTDFGKLPEYAISRALNVTKNETALVVERTSLNEALEEKHASEEFKLDGKSTPTTNISGKPEVDSVENEPDIPALKLGMTIKASPAMTGNVTETWTLEDGGKTLVIDRQVTVAGMGMVEIKGYYDKK